MTHLPDETSGIDEREWQRQEDALRAHRAGASAAQDARDADYRRIARALATPPDAPLPSNFAYAQAQRIEAIAAARRREDARFVRRLKAAFALGYGGAVLLALFVFRDALFGGIHPADALAGGGAWLPWLLLCAGIVGGMQMSSRRLRRR